MLFLSNRIPKNSFNLQGVFTVTPKFCRTHICILSPAFPPETQIVQTACYKQISLTSGEEMQSGQSSSGCKLPEGSGPHLSLQQHLSLHPLRNCSKPHSRQCGLDPGSTRRRGSQSSLTYFPHSWHSLLRQQKRKSQVEIPPHPSVPLGPHCREEALPGLSGRSPSGVNRSCLQPGDPAPTPGRMSREQLLSEAAIPAALHRSSS